jgi:predicted PurR-regulated permease PerM
MSPVTMKRHSFILTLAILVAVVLFQLATPFITILFGYLTLHYLGKVLPKRAAILMFSILVVVLMYLFGHFISEAVGALPLAANKSIPIIVDYANKWGFTPPFTDSETLKSFSLHKINSQLHSAFKVLSIFTKEFVYVIIGVVATCAIFSNASIDLGKSSYRVQNNLYSEFTRHLSDRFRCFFSSFHTVMGAQVIISAVNTFFTGLFLVCLWALNTPLPYSFVIVVVTFLCGLLPIIGNLISNSIIFMIGLTQSIHLAVISLVYLIVLHKFEYFLNSKIIGGRIKNPMWLTLLGLLVGERLAGIPGMILAPVLLNYLKLEGSQIEVANSGEPR